MRSIFAVNSGLGLDTRDDSNVLFAQAVVAIVRQTLLIPKIITNHAAVLLQSRLNGAIMPVMHYSVLHWLTNYPRGLILISCKKFYKHTYFNVTSKLY